MNLKGKIALVTGGSAGIGKAIAAGLGKDGVLVVITSRDEERLRRAAEELQQNSVEVFHLPCDLQELHQLDHLARQIEERFSRLDILVNNAGISDSTPLLDADSDGAFDRTLRVNLHAPFYLIRRVVPLMPEGGRIINISSVLGRFAVPGKSGYCASKHGLIGLTRVAALELAPRKITVNAICPGWVETEMAKREMEGQAKVLGISYQEFRRKALQRVPLQEIIEPQEVAEMVRFLVSPAAVHITGQAYNLCGGQVMN